MAKERQSAFTLLELLIVVTLAAVLLGGALPAFRALLESQRVTGVEHQFLAAIAHTRQAAITSGVPVTLCPSRDGETCLSRGHWHEGWLAFQDRDRNRRRDPAQPVLLRNHGLDGVTLTSSKWRRRITFQPTGTAGGSNGTFTLCVPGDPDNTRAVILSRLGRARASDTGPGGRPLSCP